MPESRSTPREVPPARKIGVLADATRARIHRFVRRAGRAVLRDEVASGTGVSRALAAFHLDKLVEAGLLKTHLARPPGRSGPGAGRTARYYEPSTGELNVSVPHRDYQAVGRILADAVEADPTRPLAAARELAAADGRALASQIPVPKRATPMRKAEAFLEAAGFEPFRVSRDELAMRNCPYHALAKRSPAVVCTLASGLACGALEAMGAGDLEVEVRPDEQMCCIRVLRKEQG